MRFRLAFSTAATLIGLCGAAHADVVSGGPVYGGPASVGGQITCRFFNAGVFSVTLPLRQIWTNTNLLVAPVADSCNVALAPARYCAFTANIAGNLAYSCRAYVSGIDNNVSGVAEVKNPASAILNSVPID